MSDLIKKTKDLIEILHSHDYQPTNNEIAQVLRALVDELKAADTANRAAYKALTELKGNLYQRNEAIQALAEYQRIKESDYG